MLGALADGQEGCRIRWEEQGKCATCQRPKGELKFCLLTLLAFQTWAHLYLLFPWCRRGTGKAPIMRMRLFG